jgi:hypothetical protein
MRSRSKRQRSGGEACPEPDRCRLRSGCSAKATYLSLLAQVCPPTPRPEVVVRWIGARVRATSQSTRAARSTQRAKKKASVRKCLVLK